MVMGTFSTRSGSLFDSSADAFVNPVNCVGVMGAGLAKTFKRRYPDMFTHYRDLCDKRMVSLGEVTLWINTSANQAPRFIVNFPTKHHWKDQSSLPGIRAGLTDLASVMTNVRFPNGAVIRSVAVPALGCGLGGLPWDTVRPLIEQFAVALPDDFRVEIYPPNAEITSITPTAEPVADSVLF